MQTNISVCIQYYVGGLFMHIDAITEYTTKDICILVENSFSAHLPLLISLIVLVGIVSFVALDWVLRTYTYQVPSCKDVCVDIKRNLLYGFSFPLYQKYRECDTNLTTKR